MTICWHHQLRQGSEAWLAARCGLLTASTMKLILTPTLKPAGNPESRQHLWTLLSQRLTGKVEAGYVSEAMLRGHAEERDARQRYAELYAPVQQSGFVTNDGWGFTIGYSPDGLVGDAGLIECKSRSARFQFRTIAEDKVPDEYMLQLQTGLLVTQRQWIDFVSYSAGLPLFVKRVWPDTAIQAKIVDAADRFERELAVQTAQYRRRLAAMATNREVPV